MYGMFRLCEFLFLFSLQELLQCVKANQIFKVLNEYETKGFAFLRRVFNEKDYLEKVTGLDELYRESEKVIEGMEGLDWDSEGRVKSGEECM